MYFLLLLDCFDFAYGYICVCIYSITLSIVVINFCLYIGLLHFCGVFLFSFFFHFFFSLFYNFNFLNLLYFSTFILLFAFPTVLSPLQLIFNVYKSSYTSVQLFISILSSFSFFPFLSTYLFCFSCFIPHLAPCFSFVFQFVL